MIKKLHYLFKVETVSDRRISGWLTSMLIILLYFGGASSIHATNDSDNFNNVEDSKTILEDLTVYAKIVRSYNITDASTEDKVCFPTKGKGVIFQRAEGCQGSHHIWRVADNLTMHEYDNDTATIVGSVIDKNGKIGKVNIALYNKSNKGNTWEAKCYQEGITDPRSLYQSFSGTITVDGKAFNVELKDAKQHYILADGAGFEPGRFGFGAWTGGSFGGCTEWFGNLDPIVNCELTVDAGEDIEICNVETVELTAVANNISECIGGCEYPIERVARCHDASNLSDVWLANITGANRGFVTSSSKFKTLDDGTARYTAIASNGLDNIEVDITFSGYTTKAPKDSPKENDCETYDTSNWVYWTHTSGTIKTENHGTLIVSRAGPSMQMGNGADVTRTGFVASGWLTITGGDGFYTAGDINIKLKECIAIPANSSVDYLWTTDNGNIIGNANQKTITVDKAGTYTVKALDCEDCEAIDTVVITELSSPTVDAGKDIEVCNEDTVELTAVADNISECVGGCEYPIERTPRCHDSSNLSDVWLANITGTNNGFVTSTSKFETFENGTAHYTAIATNGLDNIEVDITFSGYTTKAPQDSPKENNCGTYDTTDWVYWTNTFGTIKTQNHGTLTVSRAGPSMQMGNGGDVTRNGFGASGWLTISGGDGFYTAGDVNIKLGECIPIPADSSVDYMWTTTDGNIIGDADQKTITVDKSGTYTVTVKDCETCEGSDSVVVTMNEVEADAGEDQVICKGDEVELTATGGGTYLWSTGETTASIKVSPTADVTYSVTVTSDEGCKDTDEVMVSLNPDVTADAGADVAICKGDEVELTATGGGTYLWSTGETTASIKVSPTADVTYSVTVTSDEGCKDTDEVMVTVGNATADASDDMEICKGEEATLTVEGDGTYLWSTGETTQSITVSPESTTEYSVTVTNGNCEATDNVIVTVGDATADAGADQTICEGEEVTLTVTGEGTYLWSTGEITPSITVSPETTTEYSVIVTNGNCEAMDEVVVNVDEKVVIGDYVWLDENRNGMQDDGATGIKGMSVKLYQCNGDLVDSTETNDDGYYKFEVCPGTGDYYVVFGEVPEGLKFTALNQGSDTTDSNADSGGVTACFTITDKDDLTIDAGLIEICDINLEVIEEAKICVNETLELTATLTDNTEECEGGCVYPVIEKGKCADPTPDNEVLLTSFVNGKKVWHRFKASEQRFETFEDGSARYTATATDGVDNIEVDVTFTGHSMNPGPMGPKANECQDYDMSDWEYWSTWSGTISSQNHGIFTLSMKGAYFQMGIGADVTKSGFGASGWFFATGGDGFYVDGDINIALEECIEKSATFKWTTADGSIISDANQKTITIDKPGTYVIEATNCIDCIAVKKIVVTEDILCSTFAKSANTPKMMKVYPVPVQSGGTLTIEFDLEDTKNVSALEATSLKAAVSGNPNKENVVVVLYDMTGRLVNTPRTFEIVDGKAIIYLDLDYIQTGKYIVKAMNRAWSDSKSIIVK